MSSRAITTPIPKELLQRQFSNSEEAFDGAIHCQSEWLCRQEGSWLPNANGLYRRDILCCKAGKPSAKNTWHSIGSRRTDCKFEIRAYRMDDNGWKLEVEEQGHNNPLSESPAAFPQHRIRETELRDMIRTMSVAQVAPKKIQTALRQFSEEKGTQNHTSASDIYNERQKYNTEKLCRLSPVQPLLRELEEFNHAKSDEEERFVYRFTLDAENSVDYLFIAHPLSMRMLRKSNECLLIDSTYKTNKYHMPLLHISGRNCMNRSFDIGFVFMKGETAADFEKALRPPWDIYASNAWSPTTITTELG